MKNYPQILCIFFLTLSGIINAQVGIGNLSPNDSSILDLTSDDKGLLIPRMTTIQRNLINSPALSLIIFNTDEGGFNYYNGAILGWQDFFSGYNSVSAIEGVTRTPSATASAIPDMNVIPSVSGTYSVAFNSQYNNIPITTFIPFAEPFLGTLQAKIDLLAAYNELISKAPPMPAIAAAMGGGQTLTPGVYSFGGAASITGTLNLDAQGDSTKLFIFQIGGAFACGASTVINLMGDAKASNVFWVTEGAPSIGQDSTFRGTIIAHAGAAGISGNTTLEGRLFTMAGAVTFGPGTAFIPSGTSPINLGSVAKFVLFTGTGDVSNTGTSYVTGNIGTNLGSVAGFSSITHTGYDFTPSSPIIIGGCGCNEITPNNNPSVATFSIYQNGNLIPSSTKSLSSSSRILNFSLQAIATVEAGQPIEVRWKTDSQPIALGNRTLTVIKVQ